VVTATENGSTTINTYIVMEEWSGEFVASGAGARDGGTTARGVSASGSTISSGTFTTAQSSDLLVTGAYCLAQNCSLSAATGFTIHTSQGVPDLTGFGTGYMALAMKVTGAAGSYSGDFGMTSSANDDWVVVAQAYLTVAPPSPRHRSLIF
jgi:hypothetical protein